MADALGSLALPRHAGRHRSEQTVGRGRTRPSNRGPQVLTAAITVRAIRGVRITGNGDSGDNGACFASSVHDEERLARRSPIMFTETVVSRMNAPGAIASHGSVPSAD
jgi:hypothetical protein